MSGSGVRHSTALTFYRNHVLPWIEDRSEVSCHQAQSEEDPMAFNFHLPRDLAKKPDMSYDQKLYQERSYESVRVRGEA